MNRALLALWLLLCTCAMHPALVAGQDAVVGKAALPAVPYWWSPADAGEVAVVPLLWFNQIDGGDEGCCVVGVAARRQLGPARFWLGVGFGTAPDAGTPAAIEVTVEMNRGWVSVRELHGRGGVSALYSVVSATPATQSLVNRLSLGISALWLDDERYLETVPLFSCPGDAPAVPCEQVSVPYPWSDGEDHALVAELEGGTGAWGLPKLRGRLAAGLKLVGGDHDYLRAELEATAAGRLGRFDWSARAAGGWTSGDAPLQRRFLLEGADPATRWINPYLDAKGALFSELPFVGGDVPYYMAGGPNLRSYEATRPLVKRYVAASGELGRRVESIQGVWGRLAGFAALAWLPGLPDRLGPESLRFNGPILFDWRELPAGEDREQGRFRARVLEVPAIWADAGLTVSGGYDRVAVMLSFPFWSSQPGFASEPVSGSKRAIALRWTLTVIFQAPGRLGG